MALPRVGVRWRLRSGATALTDTRYWLRLRSLGHGRPADYRAYLDIQLRRSLSKRRNDPGVGARILISHVAQAARDRGAVLCVGCRNGTELDEFRAQGFGRVVGIDLFSQRDDIEVMDMHTMSFAADSFDAVYSSHSLEHAYDLDAVVGEIARVARDGAVVGVEVPVRARQSAADRIEFAGLAELREPFRRFVADELWSDEQPPRSPTNEQGTAVARLVFRLQKAPAFEVSPQPVHRRPRRRLKVAAATALALLLLGVGVFGVGPEALGDWPYNAFGRDSRAHPAAPHHHLHALRHATHKPVTRTLVA